ncbi:MAG: hypothetical protein EHM84_08375, partial [Lysobacterales bacterium]
MRATRIFLLGMLAGAGVVSLANYGLQRSEPTQATAETAARTSQLQSDRTDGAPQHKEAQSTTALPQSSLTEERGAPPETYKPRTDDECKALIGGMLER